MDNIIIPTIQLLLTISPLKIGFYSIADYIGQKTKTSIIRVSALGISIAVTAVYMIMYFYIIQKRNTINVYYVNMLPNIVCLIIGITLLAIFFLINYYSIKTEKELCMKVIKLKNTDSLALINTEKTLELFYFALIFTMFYIFMKSVKKYRKGIELDEIMLDWKFYLMAIITMIIFFAKIYQMYLLLNMYHKKY